MMMMIMMIDVLRPLCAHGRLNGPCDLQSEVKDEITFRYDHAKIRTRVVVICGPTHYH